MLYATYQDLRRGQFIWKAFEVLHCIFLQNHITQMLLLTSKVLEEIGQDVSHPCETHFTPKWYFDDGFFQSLYASFLCITCVHVYVYVCRHKQMREKLVLQPQRLNAHLSTSAGLLPPILKQPRLSLVNGKNKK